MFGDEMNLGAPAQPAESPNEPAQTVSPGTAPDPTAQPSVNGGGQPAFDPTQFNERLRSFGTYNVQSPDDLVQIIEEKHRAMEKSQRENAQTQTRFRKHEPILNRLESDRAYQERVYNASREYAQEAQGVSENEFANLNPVLGEIRELQQWRADKEMGGEIESLSRNPKYEGFINDAVKADIALECAARGDYDPKRVFLDKYGDKLIEHRENMAVQAAMKKIQTNNAAGAGLVNPTFGAPTSPLTDPATLTKDEAIAWEKAELDKIAKVPGYANKVATDALVGSMVPPDQW